MAELRRCGKFTPRVALELMGIFRYPANIVYFISRKYIVSHYRNMVVSKFVSSYRQVARGGKSRWTMTS